MSTSGFDIQKFLSSVTPPLKASKFLFELNTIPPGLASSVSTGYSWNETRKNLSFYAENVDIPGIALMTTGVYRYGYGPLEAKPYAPQYGSLKVLFRGDQDGFILNFMRSWMGLTVNFQMSMKDSITTHNGFDRSGTATSNTYTQATPYEVAYKSDYAASGTIILMNEKSDIIQRVTMSDIYPVAMEPVPLSWSAHNTYAQFPVQFNYSKLSVFGINPS